MSDPTDPSARAVLTEALGHILQEARAGLDRLLLLDADPRTAAELLTDPDSLVNARRTLATLRIEAAAQREALRPFALAYSRMAEPLDDLQIQVFVDPQRPDHNKSVYMSDFKRAHKAYASMTIGAETADRIALLDKDLARAAELLGIWGDETSGISQDDLDDSRRLAETYGRR